MPDARTLHLYICPHPSGRFNFNNSMPTRPLAKTPIYIVFSVVQCARKKDPRTCSNILFLICNTRTILCFWYCVMKWRFTWISHASCREHINASTTDTKMVVLNAKQEVQHQLTATNCKLSPRSS